MERSEGDRAWRRSGAFVALLVAVAWGRHLPLLTHRPFGADELQHVQAAWLTSRGLVPYRDYFEHHTPWFHFALAPLFRFFHVETSANDAEAFLLLSRHLTWIVGAVLLVLTFALGSRWRDTTTGLVAALLLAASGLFGSKAIEIRPDGLSIVAWLACLLILLRVARENRAPAILFVAAGLWFGAGVMINLKLLLAAPGVAAALLWQGASVGRAGAGVRSLVWFATAAAITAAATGVWFAGRGAFGELAYHTLVLSIRDWPQRVPSWPIVRHLIGASPFVAAVAILGFGRTAAGLGRDGARSAPDRLLVLVAASLAAGALVVREPWPQYFLLPLPILAVLGASLVVDAGRRIGSRAAPPAVAAAAVVVAASALAMERPLRRDPLQRAILRHVIENTAPDETILNGWGSHNGLFRPHAFRMSFLPRGWLPLVGRSERTRLLHDLETCRVRPAIVFLDRHVLGLSPQIAVWLRKNYEPVGLGSMWRPKNARCRDGLSARRSQPLRSRAP